MSDQNESLFDLAGGEPALRRVVTRFYEAIFIDPMIGFFFRGLDQQHLIDKEVELAAQLLGAKDIQYTGRSIRQAHARHPIMGGQFDRRLQILREAMQAYDLPEAVQRAWVEHTLRMRPLVTRDALGKCTDPGDPRAPASPKKKMIFDQSSDG